MTSADGQPSRKYSGSLPGLQNKIHLFWPKLFAAWFKEFPCHQPTNNNASASEAEPDTESDAPPEAADEAAIALGKCK